MLNKIMMTKTKSASTAACLRPRRRSSLQPPLPLPLAVLLLVLLSPSSNNRRAVVVVTAQNCLANGVCDTHERCSVWEDEGECLLNRAYMLKHCPASCRGGDGASKYKAVQTGKGQCDDAHPRCHLWADSGECHANESNMRKYCPKACGFCTTTTPSSGGGGGGGGGGDAVDDDDSEYDGDCEDQHKNCAFWAEKVRTVRVNAILPCSRPKFF